MNFTSKIIAVAFLASASACTDSYIDELNYVAPGEDETAPQIAISYPVEGTLIRVTEDVTAITAKFEVQDDIEIASITLSIDGKEIGSYNDFKDYRRAALQVPVDNITNGPHTMTISANDITDKTTVSTVTFDKVPPYKSEYENEIFYIPFDGEYVDLVTISPANEVGNPGFAGQSVAGTNAYAGATGAYLTYPGASLANPEFSASFWYKINNVPDRAGILVMGPIDEANPQNMNNRTAGFRLFREGSATRQTFKLNVGTGTSENWFDGGDAASIDPTTSTEWIHLAFTISADQCTLYINGNIASQGSYPGISWEGCDLLSIGSGAPRFAGWGHLSDLSFLDELRIFDKALSQAEVQEIMNDEQP